VSKLEELLSKSLFALSKAFFDKSKSRYPAGFAKIYLQKSALMTAQRDLYLGNSPSSFDTDIHPGRGTKYKT
jgi:hypothetical protein